MEQPSTQVSEPAVSPSSADAASVAAASDPASASTAAVSSSSSSSSLSAAAVPAALGFPFEPTLTLDSIRASHRAFSTARNWGQYHSPRNLLLALVGEVGELSEIFQWKHEVAEGLPQFSAAEKQHVGEEMSDVLLYLCAMADRCHIDLAAAVTDKMRKNEAKYPAEIVHGSSKKYNQYGGSQQAAAAGQDSANSADATQRATS